MKKTPRKGFTLIEILVVATIISLLAAGAAISYSQFVKQSRDAKRKTDIEQIRAALEMYRSNNTSSQYSAYSGNCVSYGALTAPIKYIQSMPTDPKTGYYYRCVITVSDYTIAAYLEGTISTCPDTLICGTGINCNYCVGPYGKK